MIPTMTRRLALCLLMLLIGTACSTAPDSAAGRQEIVQVSREKLQLLKATNAPLYKTYSDSSIGVVVLPKVGKGGLIVGGAYGKGVLFEAGQVIGYCDVYEGTVGAQIGGQAYTQLIFFKDEASLLRLKNGSLSFSAQVSAVAANADANKQAHYTDGVAVIVMDARGLMAEASVSGQKFSYVPAEVYE